MAKWQGPFEIKRKLGPTTYEIATPGLDQPSKVLLKEWIPHPEKEPQVLMIQKVMEKEELEDQYLPQPVSECFNIYNLPKDHQSQVRELFATLTFFLSIQELPHLFTMRLR